MPPPPIDAQLGSAPTAYAIAAAITHLDIRRIGFIAVLLLAEPGVVRHPDEAR
jgi:hypothetical protein